MPLLPLPTEPAQQSPAQTELSPGRPPVLRVLFLVAMFAVGLFGTAAVFSSLLPFPDVPGVTSKVEWLAQHGDEYDTLFLGTSRTNGHILPELFDRLMAEAGMPTHSFNLGINAMRAPEDTYVLEQALAHRRAPLKLVVIEANEISASTNDDQAHGTSRAVYWHDWKRFMAVNRSILETRINGRRQLSLPNILWKLDAGRYNLNLFFSKTLSAGRGLEWLTARLAKTEKQADDPLLELGKRSDGYAMYDTPVRAINDSEWNILQKRLDTLASKPIRWDYKSRVSQSELQTKCRLVAPFGGEVVTFVPPLVGGNVFAPDPARFPALPWLSFADPQRFPELFKRENRLDSGHLNQQGAEIFTRMLVEKIVAAKALQK